MVAIERPFGLVFAIVLEIRENGMLSVANLSDQGPEQGLFPAEKVMPLANANRAIIQWIADFHGRLEKYAITQTDERPFLRAR